MKRIILISFSLVLSVMSAAEGGKLRISGIYPELAYYNNEAECGTGAVVPWGGKLWIVTYAPHSPYGSSDKLYELDGDLNMTVRPESVGGTPADRMIHRESGQLLIGPYLIDSLGNVRAISYATAPGRYTAAARHLYHPDSLLYIGTMEEGFYELDVRTAETRMLWSDDNAYRRPDGFPVLESRLVRLPGWHGKGMYSGQGVLVYANNGEYGQKALEHFDAPSGALCEWDGKDWKLIRRNQFTDITGPGGIYGNDNPATDQIWTVGFDHKSLLLGVRDTSGWSFFRLPKASYSYDGAHGWNTEWPRIRNVGTPENPDYLMTMHGMFWKFPGSFRRGFTGGIRPRSSYLKVVGDFSRWNDSLVLGCDDSAQKEFLNVRKAKGDLVGPGQSNSNLWFLPLDGPDALGPSHAGGYVWLRENPGVDAVSEPFLFAGWKHRRCWMKNSGTNDTVISFEIDRKGNGNWKTVCRKKLGAGRSISTAFSRRKAGEWIRVRSTSPTTLSIAFVYSNGDLRRASSDNPIFSSLARIDGGDARNAYLYALGGNRRKLGVLTEEGRYYEVDSRLGFRETTDSAAVERIRTSMQFSHRGVEVLDHCVRITDDKERRWCLPVGNSRYAEKANGHKVRVCREVATERDLFNCSGTFYELPAENADGFAKIRPIASHNLDIFDYASYRGLLVMSGTDASAVPDGKHLFSDGNGEIALWAGEIDDLWKLGKPTGHGGPWCGTCVTASEVSDPYLFGFYDKRTLLMSHDSASPVGITVEFDPTGDGEWMAWKTFTVPSGKEIRYVFDKDFCARWIRFRSSEDCKVTTVLDYE